MSIVAPLRGVVCRGGAVLALAAIAAALLVTACATPPSDPAARIAFEQANDPLEPVNRKILDVNLFLDRILFKPVAKIYVAVLPEEARDAVKRMLDNMKSPVIVVNNMLQADPKRAGIAAGRFVVNSTFGLAGLVDVANKWGLEKQNGDFGQTLFVWGLPQGPYLILPILGPSNARDGIGMAANSYIDPFSYLATVEGLDNMQIARYVVDGVDERARVIDVLDDLQKNSLDFYAQLRSLSQQRRAAELRHGTAPPPTTGFYDIPDKATNAPQAAPAPAPNLAPTPNLAPADTAPAAAAAALQPQPPSSPPPAPSARP